MQEVKPLTFYYLKLSKAEINYTMIEKEFISIVETFKYFRNILLGHEIKVITYHDNISYETI